MRVELKKHDNEVVEVTAIYRLYAVTNSKRNYLFKKVCLNGIEICDHIWIKSFKNENKFKLEKHAEYKLIGEVKQYYKRDKEGNKMIDYCITNPRVIKINS